MGAPARHRLVPMIQRGHVQDEHVRPTHKARTFAEPWTLLAFVATNQRPVSRPKDQELVVTASRGGCNSAADLGALTYIARGPRNVCTVRARVGHWGEGQCGTTAAACRRVQLCERVMAEVRLPATR
jgi:hypothetical protein